jgi:hypothetical protein
VHFSRAGARLRSTGPRLVEGFELLVQVLQAPAGRLKEFLVVVGEVTVGVLRARDDAFDEGGTLFDLTLEGR